ncbi:diguanylate cyclase [Pseudomonas helleri]|uniref:diguanylate cyclase n=1 Tax=Pseudomonas helleri TaxID=1608996 RepID=A0A6A7YD93_9PSED|nr:GGDEF domain-containing protein [Pseudomonas helleri]MQT29276.1 diguanylate cyclase [Pseudomonas helleri]MQT45963.1 diguanylate cyclase [Pseudomonas helleri]MQT88991.1 diguanylate cyclase [Pseudomonas helleri]
MSADDASRWKEKYLKSVEQQDKLERRWNARLDLLRRGLVRSTLAAEGTDRTVDQCMKEMREAVRTDDMDAPLAALLPRLEKAVLDSEQRRETRIDQMSVALNALVTQLQALPLPRDVSKPLKAFAKQLDNRVTQAREIPLLLSELSTLQGRALAPQQHTAEPAKPGLLQRLFGTQEADKADLPESPAPAPVLAPPKVSSAPAPRPTTPAPAEVPETLPAQAPPEANVETPPPSEPPVPEPEVVDEAVVIGALESVVALVDAENARLEEDVEAPEPAETLEQQAPVTEAAPPAEPATDATFALPESPEPTYSSVAEHIESTLLGLLNDLSLPEHHRPQAEAMRKRLEKGLNWYELLPILDDLAVLMLAITDSGQHEFETYLKQLNERLEAFQSNLQAASTGHALGRSEAEQLDNQIREHVDSLQSSVQDAVDLNSLKHILENRLEGLLGTMDHHRQQRDAREQELCTHLQGLSERVAFMEQQAQGYREHLEEQRLKALIDPLTGLPNRAAWSERLAHEVAQWQTHGNPLLIAMLDLDHFKRINDGYGHLAGDKVLKIIAAQLTKHLRPGDFVARFGGEEFVLLIPNTPLPAGLQLLETLRAAIEACPFHFKGEPVTLTASIGVAPFALGERSEQVLKRADEALYRAKHKGRNTIEFSQASA